MTEYISNELCTDAIHTLPDVNFHSDLNESRMLPQVGSDEDSLKLNENVSVLEIHSLSGTEGAIQETIDKTLTNEYITLPVASNIKYVNYICRLCASGIDIDSAISIFGFQENLALKINKYLPIIVYETDPFPKTVCKSCVAKLNEFHDLVEKSILVEEQLRQTYVFDERYIDELTKKIQQKSEPELVKPGNNNPQIEYEFQYIDPVNLNCKNSETQEVINNKHDENSNVCKFCQENLKGSVEAVEHAERHDQENTFPCLFCSDVSNSKGERDGHLKGHFDEILLRPPNSRDKTKARLQKLLKHKLKTFNKTLICKKCKETLDNVDAAVEHCVKHRPANIKSYPCVLCVRRISKPKLREHVTLHFPLMTKPILTCDNCNNLYPDEKTLKYHRCTKLRKFKCSQCNQGFKSEDRLKFHEDFHKTKSTFCDICKKDFKFESRIYLHFAGVHNGIRDKPYCCDVCGKTFTWLTVLNSHKRTHTNERPYKCVKCDARFCNKYSLNGHMPSHEDHPQFYCDKCDYHTGRKQNLQKHMSRFHKEINSSQICIRCKVCNEIFPNKHDVDLENHSNRHTQQEIDAMIFYQSTSNPEEFVSELFQSLVVTKLYQCERCDRCYASSDHLTQHRTKHSANDPNTFYQCRLCDNAFSKHDLLVKHQKVHVNITSQYTSKLSVLIVISCDICGIECVDYRQLLNHKDRGNCMMKKMSGTVRPKKVLIKKHLKPLKTHQLFVNSNGLFECPTCQRTYKNRRRYRLHLATHSNSVL